MYDEVVIQQPVAGASDADGPPGVSPVNGVSVRNLLNNADDAAFAGALLVDGFRGKMVHNVGERGLPSLVKNSEASHLNRSPRFYERNFVADYEGRRAGLLQIRFNGDKVEESDEFVSDLGCWTLSRLSCLMCVLNEDVRKGRCYVEHIAVDAGHRGRGIGKILMDMADREARRANCKVIYLHVLTNNPAIHLYERHGYVVKSRTGCLGCCIGPPGAVFLMEKHL